MAIGTIGKRQRVKMIVGAPLIFARVGVTSFWIRHSCSSELTGWGSAQPKWESDSVAFYCFFEQSCFKRASERGADRKRSFRSGNSSYSDWPRSGSTSPAIAAADNLHRKREIYLLGEDVGQKQAVAFKESDFLVVVQIEVKFVVLGDRGHRR